MEVLDETRLREMVYGGAVLGAGGGGSIEAGLAAGREALAHGSPRMIRIEELSPQARIATLSIVGSVSAMTGDQSRSGHGLALRKLTKLDGRPIAALIPSEVGPQAVTYGWRESVTSGMPIVDAPCNGRAHPLGLMGSLGLHRRPRYVTSTVAIGESDDGRVELSLRASAVKASRIVRHAAGQSRIPLAVARNPLPASYVARHAAVGGLRYAQHLGKIVLRESSRGLPALLERLQRSTGGCILAQGRVTSANLKESGGFTVGGIVMRDLDGNECCIAVCNEYLAFQRNGAMMAAFPDLIVVFDFDSVTPLSSPDVKSGNRVAVFGVPRRRLKLGSTMKDPALLRPVERLLNLNLSQRSSESVRRARSA